MSEGEGQDTDALTSLRFFAAFYVLVFHSGASWVASSTTAPRPLVHFLRNGYLGVSFFFVLSGFILAYVYHDSSMSWPRVKRFMRARFARIYPIYLLSLLLMIPFVEVTPLGPAVWQFLMLQRWFSAAFPWPPQPANWNMQAWTLSVEFFFYLLFPGLLLWSRRLSNRAIAVSIVLVAALLSGFGLPGFDGVEGIMGGMNFVPATILRTPEFVYGALLGSAFSRGMLKGSPRFMSLLILGLLIALCSSDSRWVASPAAVLFGLIIAITPLCMRGGIVSRFMVARPLILLGKASYGIYILQLPVRMFVRDYLEPHFSFIARVAYIPLLVLVSIVVLQFFEEPARKWLRGAR